MVILASKKIGQTDLPRPKREEDDVNTRPPEEIGKSTNKFHVRSGSLQEQRADTGIVHDIVDERQPPLDFQENSEIYKNMKFENTENVFNITQKLIKEQSKENLNVKTLAYQPPSWKRSTL